LLKAQTNLKAHAKYVLFYISIFLIVILAQTNLKTHVYFYFFLFRYTICIDFIFNRRTFGILRIFFQSFFLNSLLNQSQTYQGNPCGVYPGLSSLSGSGVIQTLWHVSSNPLLVRITSSGIRASTLVTGSILSNFYFFSLCNLSQVHVLFYYLRSCLHLVTFLFVSCCVLVFVFVLVLVSFRFCVKNSVWILLQILFMDNLAYWNNLGV